jgi:small GTP-binding protein
MSLVDEDDDVVLEEYVYKILVVGELSCGKTSFIHRYVNNSFSNAYRATIGVDFALKSLRWDDRTNVRLQLWDIAGQERFGHMTRVYYKEAVGAFVVYDVTRPKTFEAVTKWKDDIDDNLQPPIAVVLLANKSDLLEEPQEKEKLDRFCEEHGFIGWFETSAKDHVNVDEAGAYLVDHILKNDPKVQQRKDRNVVDLSAPAAGGGGDGKKEETPCPC